MIKKCIVEFDELHKPINVIEIKDFRNATDFQNFVKTCNLNREQAKIRYEEQLAREKEEKENILTNLNNAARNIDCLKTIIKALLGKCDLACEDIDNILEEIK